MDCFINGGIFLRSNGSVACGCDTGARTTLHKFDQNTDYVNDVFFGKQYRRIRENLKQGKWPYNEAICANCALLHAEREFNPACADDRIIEMFHLEPSFACTLECPSCTAIRDRKGMLDKHEQAGHLLLDPGALDKILDDLERGGFTVRTFALEGHGEPLLNRKIWDMIANIKRRFPQSILRVITNANDSRFAPEMLECGLDEIVFSIDGVSPETYLPYRVKGSFEDAYQFMEDFSQAVARTGKPIRTIWKYVVFNHNDRDEHLLEAQRLAKQAGVQTMMFILTRLGPVSKRIYELADIPLLEGGIPVVAETNVLSLDDLRQRLLDSCTKYLSEEPTWSSETALCRLIARLIEDDEHRQLKQYQVFKGLVDEAAQTDERAYDRMVAIHDRLLAEGVFPVVAETHVLSLDDLRRRLYDWCTRYLSEEPTLSSETALCGLIARLIEDDEHRQFKQYQVFKGLVDEAARTDLRIYYRMVAIHDRLLAEGVFKLSGRPEDSGRLFDESFYLEANRDVAEAVGAGTFESALDHFTLCGALEGRAPHPA